MTAAAFTLPRVRSARARANVASPAGTSISASAFAPRAANCAASAKPSSLYSAEYGAACTELRKRLKEREAKKDRVTARYNIDALVVESDRLGEVRDLAFEAIERFPVATISDLIAKAQMVANETEGTFNIDILLADLRRIGGEAVA